MIILVTILLILGFNLPLEFHVFPRMYPRLSLGTKNNNKYKHFWIKTNYIANIENDKFTSF